MVEINLDDKRLQPIRIRRGLTTLTLYGTFAFMEELDNPQRSLKFTFWLSSFPPKQDHAEFVIDTAANYFNDSQHDEGKWHVEV